MFPEPNKEQLVFESIEPYIPVLGVTPATDGIPSVKIIVAIAAVFVPLTVTVEPSKVAIAVIASVFADICKPWPNIFNSCKLLFDFISATLPDKSVTVFLNSLKLYHLFYNLCFLINHIP
jgi:hypothetical protein